MSILYPKIRLAWLPSMLRYAALGALLAGFYGILHDQVTYSISPEYFTRFKFSQFHYADFGLPPRAFVAEIGFLATWWVGFFAAWFIARITVPKFPPARRCRYTMQGILMVFVSALVSSTVGYELGMLHGPDYSRWDAVASSLGIVDQPAFVRVAYMHNAGYLGGLLGLLAAVVYVRAAKTPNPPASVQASVLTNDT